MSLLSPSYSYSERPSLVAASAQASKGRKGVRGPGGPAKKSSRLEFENLTAPGAQPNSGQGAKKKALPTHTLD